MNILSKQAIVEVASTSGDRDILYSYVAIEKDHIVGATNGRVFGLVFSS